MAAQGACPPAGTRLTGTLGTTATAAGAAARDRTAQDPGTPQLGCQGLQLPELLEPGYLVSWTADHESQPPCQQDQGQDLPSAYMLNGAGHLMGCP